MHCNSSANITICNQLINNAFLDLSWKFRPLGASIPGRQTANRGRDLSSAIRPSDRDMAEFLQGMGWALLVKVDYVRFACYSPESLL